MKNRLLTNTARTIRRAFPRFISLLMMSMLGVFVFSGLQATAPDMITALDHYMDAQNIYDMRVVSDMGLTDGDVRALSELSGIADAEGSKEVDVILPCLEGEAVVKLTSLPEKINVPKLLEGRLPQKAGEIAIEPNFLIKNELSLGDTLPVEDESLAAEKLTVVGTVDSSLYFQNVGPGQDRGDTSVGNGTVNYYAFTAPETFDLDVYTGIYLTAAGARELTTSSKDYVNLIADAIQQAEGIKQARQDARYRALYDDAEKEINSAEEEADAELSDAEKELADAEKKLADGQKALDTAARELADARKTLDVSRNELDAGKDRFAAALSANGLKKEELPEKLSTLQAGISQLEAALSQIPEQAPQYAETAAQLSSLQQQEAGIRQLTDTAAKLDAGEKGYAEGLSKYESGRAEYEKNLRDFNESKADYADGLEEYNRQKADAETKIADARAELADLKHPTWYLYDRMDMSTYSDYVDDCNSVANLAKVFPLVFFAVAVLVSLISMNRMVEEERGEIGTLKSLGFSNGRIMIKYFLFSFLATAVGGLVGSVLGLIILPTMVFNIYHILFDVPNLVLLPNLGSTLLGIGLVILCVCGTCVLTVQKELKSKASELMRPKPPKSGKRVVLEKVGRIWNRLTFSQKVTTRNLFRYKKRVFVTLGGIAACTALILCGFGIRDSITDIPSEQFGKIFTFDAMVYGEDLQDEDMFLMESVERCTPTQRVNATVGSFDTALMITEDADALSQVVQLREDGTDAPLRLTPGKAIITEKLSKLADLKVGDTVEVVDTDHNAYRFTISGITKNYFEHYVFVDAATFRDSGGEYRPNLVYLHTAENADAEQIKSDLLENDEILGVSFREEMIKSADDMLSSLNSVVWILIVLAALLAFVVLYNLATINIGERKREIATLKVLGFYDKEVDDYITKEMAILTVLGILLGLVLGYFLTNVVVQTVEIERCRFMYVIKPISYLLSAAISAAFTLIVNFVTHFRLKRICMIDSLKSVE